MKPKDWKQEEEPKLAQFYVETIHSNISDFLSNKKHLTVHLQDGGESFDTFLDAIDAEGDLQMARETWMQIHNAR